MKRQYKKLCTKKLPNENQININKELMSLSKTELIEMIFSLRERLWGDIEFVDRRKNAEETERYHRARMKYYVEMLINALNNAVKK